MPVTPPREMTTGRRLRLDRRKAGLSQDELASLLGVEKQAITEMELNRAPLTPAAEAFIANPPARVPAGASAPRPPKQAAEKAGDEPPAAPLPGVEEPGGPGAGPGPRVGKDDRAPRAAAARPAHASTGEIAELEKALLTFFAGEAFLVPREQPDGTVVQVEAVIPGLAQIIGVGDEFDGQIIRIYAPGMARAWANLARENATVRKILVGITYGGAYRGVIAATLPAVMAIAGHHGLLPQLGGGPGRTVEGTPPSEPEPEPGADGQFDPFAQAREQHEPPPTFGGPA